MPWAIYHYLRQNTMELGTFQWQSSTQNDQNMAQTWWKMAKVKKKIEDIAKIKNDMQICDMGYWIR